MENKLYSKIFLWLFLGLAVTFATGYYVCTNENMIYNIFSTGIYWLIFLIEFVLVIFLSSRIQKMKYVTAIICYILYSFVSGLTFSSVFVLFDITSIMIVFGVTSALFAIFGAIGYMTKIDLSKFGMILLIGLIALLVMSIINIFIGNTTFDIIICAIGIIIFIGYIAYDMQTIKELQNYIDEDKLPVYGAFTLYLDFINLFLYIIRLFGNSKD